MKNEGELRETKREFSEGKEEVIMIMIIMIKKDGAVNERTVLRECISDSRE
jgi:hypothetical protein